MLLNPMIVALTFLLPASLEEETPPAEPLKADLATVDRVLSQLKPSSAGDLRFSISASLTGSETPPLRYLAVTQGAGNSRVARIYRVAEPGDTQEKPPPPALLGELRPDGAGLAWVDHSERKVIAYPAGTAPGAWSLTPDAAWVRSFVARHRDDLKIEVPDPRGTLLTLRNTKLTELGDGRRGIVKLWLETRSGQLIQVRTVSPARDGDLDPMARSAIIDIQLHHGEGGPNSPFDALPLTPQEPTAPYARHAAPR